MSKVFKQGSTTVSSKELKEGLSLERLRLEPFRPAKIELENAQLHETSCIGCEAPRCIRYSSEELQSSFLADFPSDHSDMVCPTNAIAIQDDGIASINTDACISCGLCINRCPMGAISISENGSVKVANTPNSIFVENKGKHAETVSTFLNIKKAGVYAVESPDLIEHFSDMLEKASAKIGGNFKNILVRNFLIELGNETLIRRRGDVYLRMDGVVSHKYMIAALEIEGSAEAILDAPRNILDDIAVLCSRYGLDKDKACGLIVSYALANQRTEYWRVIDDIEAVLGINIYTITIPALAILLWNRAGLDLSLYLTSADSCSIRDGVERNLNKKVNYPLNGRALFESVK